jgi:peroxiredoxin Q/BCP
MNMQVGDIAPEFALPDQDNKRRSLGALRGQWVVLYFYPKDDTPGCTKEACSMRDTMSQFNALDAAVLGVSVDSVTSHKKFADKFYLNFPILSDQDKHVVTQYGVWGEKSFMGKTFMGTHRTTFVIDPQGAIAKIYSNVKPENHAAEVSGDLATLQSNS